MKNSPRDERLDKYVGQEVEIIFADESSVKGILEFAPITEYSFRRAYRVGEIFFAKSTVKVFRKKGCEKWEKTKKTNGRRRP